MFERLKRNKLVACVVLFMVFAVVYCLFSWIFARPFMYAGTLETTRVILTSRVASDVSELYVAEGDSVAVGDALMELSCDSYKVQAAQINNDYNRIVELHSRGHASGAELDAVTARKNGNDLNLQYCHVVSPLDGIITTKFREVGEVVAPGTTLIAVSNPYDIWAYFYVPYDALYKLKVGQSVTGYLPEAGNMKFAGKIIKISEHAEFTPKNVQTREERMRLVYGIKVQFENPDMILKAGMTIESALTDD